MRVVFFILLAACASPDNAPAIDHARPPFGPVAGGTEIEIVGTGFDPVVNRVFIAGREAPVVRTLDDNRLSVIIPPGERPGDAEVVVVTNDTNVVSTGVFRYSGPPTIDSVSPANVLVSDPSTTITLRGSGFLDEGAGAPLVLLDGQIVIDVAVRNDTQLSFTAPPGIAFTRPKIELANQRGSASIPGYRYTLTDRPGLIAFNAFSDRFATFYEPGAVDTIPIPHISDARPCIYGVIRNGDGDYMASDYCIAGNWGFGRIDLELQEVVDAHVTNRLYPTMVEHRGMRYAIQYSNNRFGTLDATGDTFVQIGTTTFQCCDLGLASDGKTMWVVSRVANVPSIQTIDPDTGVVGPSTPLVPFTTITDLRWFAGTLYGAASGGMLVSIDPPTGIVSDVIYIGETNAIEVLE